MILSRSRTDRSTQAAARLFIFGKVSPTNLGVSVTTLNATAGLIYSITIPWQSVTIVVHEPVRKIVDTHIALNHFV